MLSDLKICNLYTNKRMTCFQIANVDGRSESTIWKILKKHQRLRNRSEAIKIASDEVIIQLYNLGLSQPQIAILLDIDQSTIAKRFASCNFPSRPRGVAVRIAYTNEEFQEYFLGSSFKKQLKDFVR